MNATAQAPDRPWQAEKLRRPALWGVLLALPLLAVLAFAILQPIQVLPRMTLAPGFALTDQDGSRLTSEDLRGSFVLYNFTYAGCAEGCPQTSQVMAQVQQLAQQMDLGDVPLELVTISFDPARDTPVRLAELAAQVGADTENWRFVTGDPTDLKQIIGAGFSTYYQARDDGSFEFDPAFVLVDGWGIIRAKYKSATPDLAIIERDLGLLAQEVKNSEGVGRYAYEAAHLFLCYPK